MTLKKSDARIYLDETRDMVLKIFDYRCIICGAFTKEVHEIYPISHGRKSLAGRNRVPLCGFGSPENHHDWAHRIGTRKSIPILQEKRAEFLRKKWERLTGKGIKTKTESIRKLVGAVCIMGDAHIVRGIDCIIPK